MASFATPFKRTGLPLTLGLLLRMLFIHRYPHIEGDVLVYGALAGNWLTHHVYGLTGDAGVHATLIRLPGYPMFLAACFAVFGVAHYTPVLVIQALLDLLGAWLLARLADESISPRAGTITLWLAALCPFTANYCAAPLTETLSIFCVSAALYAAWRLQQALQRGHPALAASAALGAACAYAILLRPDGVLLPLAIALGLSWCLRDLLLTRRTAMAAVAAGVLTLLPLVPWTARNWRTFHVFQPLAPRSASDPGEFIATGYDAWAKTWFLDAVSNEEVFWNEDGDTIPIDRLPARAFDSDQQYEDTDKLLDDYNETTTVTPELDARFAELARQRVAAHPVRSRVLLPLGRVADMWLRPRTEMLPTYMRWWGWRLRGIAWFPVFYGLLNVLLLAAALGAFARDVRRRLPLGMAMLLFVLLRSALLFTLPNAEPRYTLECFPVVFVCAGAAIFVRIESRKARA